MRDSGPGSSRRRRYRGPWQIRGLAAAMGRPVICQHPMSKNLTHQQCEGDLKVAHGSRVWRWRQQQWEAVQGPMTDSGLGSSM
ncbi:unnamed protein product, partial [Staurois parvus]